MSGVRILFMVFGAIIFGGYALFQLSLMGFGYYVTVRSAEMVGDIAAGQHDNAVLRLGDRVSGLLMKRAAAVSEREEAARRISITDTTSISKDRAIEIFRTVPLAAFLKPGEPMPAPEMAELYAEGRVTAYLRPLCQVILDKVATRCALITSRASLSGEDMVSVYAVFGFAPASGGAGETGYQEGQVALSNEEYGFPADLSQPVMADSYRDRFGAFLSDADRACGALREKVGFCVIKNISLTAEQAVDGTLSLTGDATFAVPSGKGS